MLSLHPPHLHYGGKVDWNSQSAGVAFWFRHPGRPCLSLMIADHDAKGRGELVGRLKRREAEAMVELYDKYGKLIYSIIFRAVNNAATAEDLTQETFFRIWSRIQTFNDERGSFEAWLVAVARNRAFDHLRSVRHTAAANMPSLDDLEDTRLFAREENQSDRIAKQRAVKQALEGLNDDQREVIELTHFEGMTQTEIANKLHKPLGTVKSLVRSALKVLRSAAGTGASL